MANSSGAFGRFGSRNSANEDARGYGALSKRRAREAGPSANAPCERVYIVYRRETNGKIPDIKNKQKRAPGETRLSVPRPISGRTLSEKISPFVCAAQRRLSRRSEIRITSAVRRSLPHSTGVQNRDKRRLKTILNMRAVWVLSQLSSKQKGTLKG